MSQTELLPDRPDRGQLLSTWWMELYLEGDSGATTWDALEELKNQVMDALGRSPPDIRRAESLTARAALMIEGQRFY